MDTSLIPLSTEETVAARALLREAPYAHLAMTEPGGPYVVPMNFAFAEDSAAPEAPEAAQDGGGEPEWLPGSVYFHTGKGRKAAALAADPRVCLGVTAGAVFVQGDDPCADAFCYRSLLIWGRARLVEDPGARRTALSAIVAKYDPGAAGMPFDEDVFGQTLLYEVVIEGVSYKQKP